MVKWIELSGNSRERKKVTRLTSWAKNEWQIKERAKCLGAKKVSNCSTWTQAVNALTPSLAIR